MKRKNMPLASKPMTAQLSTDADQANAIRALAMDAVQRANSGHPGAPMGMAEMATALWGRHLKHNPANPHWPDRDRFVLSNGHASMLLYALLHLTGYDLPMQEIKNFRQLHSKTPGHPEHGLTPGVETTTGPLGQGLANGVGMALAEKLLADEFNRDGLSIVDHHTYVFAGDGCMMEGISHEACSLAGALKLNKLVVLYDENGISIDGDITDWFPDDVRRRFESYNWQVIGPIDGHDVEAVSAAIERARQETARPSLIRCLTAIGRGSPEREGTAKAHGEPLGDDEIAATRCALNWPHQPFEIPVAVRERWDATARGSEQEAQWVQRWRQYETQYPDDASEFRRRMAGELSDAQRTAITHATNTLVERGESLASRKASQQAIEALATVLPELLGGSADLTGSNLTSFAGAGAVRAGAAGGRHINYGVREFGMAAVMNGMSLHRGYRPYGGTFLTFSDYSRNALRMAALMKQPVVHVFTHDSIGLGEDGPTHQPVEHAASLRLIPGLDVWRPADQAETAVAWAQAVQSTDRPSALLLSRQGLPSLVSDTSRIACIERGGYILSDCRHPDAVIIATGSEVNIAMQAQALLKDRRIAARVVSMPCSDVFDRQDDAWQQQVLGDDAIRVGIEAGVSNWWRQYGCCAALGVDTFGESAPAGQLYEHFGLTAQRLADLVTAQLEKRVNQ